MFAIQIRSQDSTNNPIRSQVDFSLIWVADFLKCLVVQIHIMERCFWLWQQISFLLPSCSETRLWSASRTSWLLQKSFSSCLSWWICWLHILSPVPSAALWCTVFFSFYLGEKSPRHAGGQQHLERIRNKVITDRLTTFLLPMLQPMVSLNSLQVNLSHIHDSYSCFISKLCTITILF